MKKQLHLEFLQDKEQYRSFLMKENTAPSSLKPFYKAILKELIQSHLSDRQQEIIQLYYFEQLPMARIAELLGLNKSTIQRSLVRSKRILKSEVEHFLKLYSCSPRNSDSI